VTKNNNTCVAVVVALFVSVCRVWRKSWVEEECFFYLLLLLVDWLLRKWLSSLPEKKRTCYFKEKPAFFFQEVVVLGEISG